MSEARVELTNWDPAGRYEFAVGVGFYFTGVKHVMRKSGLVEVPVAPEKQTGMFKTLLKQFADMASAEPNPIPFMVLDDCSPISVPYSEIQDLVGDHPLLFVRLPSNVGSGAKDNILQRVLGERARYVARFDADIELDPFTFGDLRDGFEQNPEAWALTSCITYWARFHASTLPEETRWWPSANMADLVVFDSSVFAETGYSDAEIRRTHDADQRLRVLAATGKKIFVDKSLSGKTVPSGSGNTMEGRLAAARYIERTRPFIRVSYPKNGTQPRLTLNKKLAHKGEGFYVPAHPLADRLVADIWE